MPSTINKLFAPARGWELSDLPDIFKILNKRCKQPGGIHPLNKTTTGGGTAYSTMHSDVVKAVLNYTGLTGTHNGVLYGKCAIVRISNAKYAAERELENGEHEVVTYNTNGDIEAAHISTTGKYTAYPALTRNEATDITTVVMAMLPALAEIDSEVADRLSKTWSDLSNDDLYFLSDAVYQHINYGNDFPANIPSDNNLDMLVKKRVSMGAFNGTLIKGSVNILAGNSGKKKPTKLRLTVKEAKAEFAIYAASHDWSEDEAMFIPSFPDDFPVPTEAIKIARRFVNTSTNTRPMRNFIWRGITSYGKSTGVEVIACILNLPLLRMTCHSNMETQQFLSDFVPDTSSVPDTAMLPDFDTITYDPVEAYFQLTGIEDENVTSDECLKAYGEAYAALSSTPPRYKHVQSNYVKALTRGYIVEIQECSRIKDSGVLVGLNEFDRPGAVIPLIDGSYAKRADDAMVIYTDNIGYTSCRPMDQSAVRRTAFAINSYTMTKDDIISRVRYNTTADDQLIESCYAVWSDIQTYCKDHDMTEGEISVTELEMLVQTILCDGNAYARDDVIDCIISKATTDYDEHTELINLIDTNASKYGLF